MYILCDIKSVASEFQGIWAFAPRNSYPCVRETVLAYSDWPHVGIQITKYVTDLFDVVLVALGLPAILLSNVFWKLVPHQRRTIPVKCIINEGSNQFAQLATVSRVDASRPEYRKSLSASGRSNLSPTNSVPIVSGAHKSMPGCRAILVCAHAGVAGTHPRP